MNRHVTIGIGALGLGLLGAQAQAQTPKDPSGIWLTEDSRARIRVEKCGPGNAQVCGYVVWIKDPLTEQGQPRLDIKNPDMAKRSRSALGLQILLGLQPDKDGRYAGQVYNADEGKNYDVSVWLEQPNEFRIRGCLMGFLCGSQAWKRVTDVAQGQLTGPTSGPGGPRAEPQWAPKPTAATPKPTAAAAKPAAPAPAPGGVTATSSTGSAPGAPRP